MATYSVHTDRYNLSKVVLRKLGVVIHTSESGVDSLPALLRMVTQPGNRPIEGSNPVRYYGSSYHAFATNDGHYVEILGPECGPYSAPPCNKDRLHICMPGWSHYTREQWLLPKSRGQIEGVARFIVDKAQANGYSFAKLSPAELAANKSGYCSHADVTYGHHISGGHTDPGTSFPWDVLASDIERLNNERLDVAKFYRVTDNGVADIGLWSVAGNTMAWVQSEAERDWLSSQGLAIRGSNGQPFTMERNKLKFLTLIGPVPPGAKTTPADFRTVVA